MDPLAIVNQFHSLAKNPQNRDTIVKDQGCLAGLVLFMDNNDPEVIKLVLQTLLLLAEHGPNKKIMLSELGMLESLKSLAENERFSNTPEIKQQASLLLNHLQGRSTSRSTDRAAAMQRIHKAPPTSQKFFVGSSNKKAKLIILQINGLTEATKKTCEEYLLTVRGVVSFTFDMTKLRCMVRTVQSVTAEALCNAIAKSKVITADQIIKNKFGEEVLLLCGRKVDIPDEEKAKLDIEEDFPDYLPEEDPVETSKTAVARPGDKDSGSSGWFGGVKSFISNTLYW
ncbi:armadillo repeat-containing protein 1 isoform X1 [Hydra vulgaris]|uniref:Armadillo repeat-containing protein 1 n=1 Tax=Hydra vulgaris TaxID=6087 RepID=T2M4G8_HYDVU|nr:armadillo repeat-containing protein 1 [Hydra vulgaris]